MIQELQIRVLPEQAVNEQSLKAFLADDQGFSTDSITHIRVLKCSIDARQRTIFVNLKLRVYIHETPTDEPFIRTEYPMVDEAPVVIVVGAGPAGLFAALRLIENGFRPIVVERGKDVHERRKDIAVISREHTVDSESNYSFGEGGAGAFSDGKLYTRSKKRGSVEKILNVFCQHGASTSILTDAHPHIGTDKLPGVIENIRTTIIQHGGEVHFQTRMDGLIIEGDEVKGITTADGKVLMGPVILATGHSARDVYRWLYSHDVELESKGLAIGVRLEHPSQLIDQIQYHRKEGRGDYLPAAEYSFVTQVKERGVYSFCMCPGGHVVPAASGPEQVVVNGMSPSTRNSPWSNSGMVVELHPDDLLRTECRLNEAEKAGRSPGYSLGMMEFQEALERICWFQGGQCQTAPAQRMMDFVKGKVSFDFPSTSYTPGLVSSPVHFWLPPFISKRLQLAFQEFGKRSRGFLTNEATVIAVETRTSSPIRILRDAESLCHVRLQGLYPCGEGAGYAGGIVSAAIDGERCADAVCQKYHV